MSQLNKNSIKPQVYSSQGYKNGCNVALKIKEPHVGKNKEVTT